MTIKLQILHLPAPDDQYPFALVISGHPGLAQDFGTNLADKIGARAIMVFPEEDVEVR